MAAILASGPDALLSHATAAALWGLIDGAPQRVDVLVRRTPTPMRGVRGHRVGAVAGDARTIRDGFPCTTPARTLIDLAAVVDSRSLDRAIRRAVDQRLFDLDALRSTIATARPGAAALRDAVDAVSRDACADVRTKSELERRFLTLLDGHGLPRPRTNVVVETRWAVYEVDALWRDRLLVVELDGWSTHRDRESFRRDHRRDADLAAAGYRVVRLDWSLVADHGPATAQRLRAVLHG